MPGIWAHFLAIEFRYQEWPCALCGRSLLVALICNDFWQPGRSHNFNLLVVLAADCTRRDIDRPESRPGWGREAVALVVDGRQQSCTIATPQALIFSNPLCRNLGSKTRPDSGTEKPEERATPV